MTKSKLTLTTIAVTFFIANVNPINATVRQQVRQEGGELRGTIVQQRQFLLTEAKKKALDKIYQNAKSQLQRRYDWLTVDAKDQILSRIEAKEKAKNIDLSDLKNKLNGLSSFSDDFIAKMAELDRIYQELLTLDKPLASIQKLHDARKAVVEINTQIRQIEVEVLRQFWTK